MLGHLDKRVHIMDSNSTAYTVLKEIAESGCQEDPFYICDIGRLVKKHTEFVSSLPRVHPFYAIKCNDTPIILEVLAALGTSFDCASKEEINKVLNTGVDPSRIIFAHPTKPPSHIVHASKMGVELMTFDNEFELQKIKKYFPNAKMIIRIKCDTEVAQCHLSNKYGCDPTTEAPKLIKIAYNMGINVVGVSFHVGSGCQDPPVFRRAIKAARELFDYACELGYEFNLLDLGGGYPGIHGTYIETIAEVINLALCDYFPDPSVTVIAEPGRFLVSSTFTLACNVHSMRTVDKKTQNGDEVHHMYYINDGIYGSLNNIINDHQIIYAQPIKEYVNPKLYTSTIWGPTCDEKDRVNSEILLPEIQLGDWLMFENMGAYTTVTASNFNGFPTTKVHIVADEMIWSMLKDTPPLSVHHFKMGAIPINIIKGLDIAGHENLAKTKFPNPSENHSN